MSKSPRRGGYESGSTPAHLLLPPTTGVQQGDPQRDRIIELEHENALLLEDLEAVRRQFAVIQEAVENMGIRLFQLAHRLGKV